MFNKSSYLLLSPPINVVPQRSLSTFQYIIPFILLLIFCSVWIASIKLPILLEPLQMSITFRQTKLLSHAEAESKNPKSNSMSHQCFDSEIKFFINLNGVCFKSLFIYDIFCVCAEMFFYILFDFIKDSSIDVDFEVVL